MRHPWTGLDRGRDGRDDAAALQPFGCVILIVHGYIEEIIGRLAELRDRFQEPCAQTVGIGGQMQRNLLRRVFRVS